MLNCVRSQAEHIASMRELQVLVFSYLGTQSVFLNLRLLIELCFFLSSRPVLRHTIMNIV